MITKSLATQQWEPERKSFVKIPIKEKNQEKRDRKKSAPLNYKNKKNNTSIL